MDGVEMTPATPTINKDDQPDQKPLPRPKKLVPNLPAEIAPTELDIVHPSRRKQFADDRRSPPKPLPQPAPRRNRRPDQESGRLPESFNKSSAYGPIVFRSLNAFPAICGPNGVYAKQIVRPFPSLKINYQRISSESTTGNRENFVEVYIELNCSSKHPNQAENESIRSQINAVERGLRAFQRLDKAGFAMAIPLGTFHELYPELFWPCALADSQTTLKSTSRSANPNKQPLHARRERGGTLKKEAYRPGSAGRRARSRSPVPESRDRDRYRDRRPDQVSITMPI